MWRKGRHVFQQAPIALILQEIKRTTTGRIEKSFVKYAIMSEPTTVEKPITSEQEETESGVSDPILSPAEVSTLHYFGLAIRNRVKMSQPIPYRAAVVLLNLFVYLCISLNGVLSYSCNP